VFNLCAMTEDKLVFRKVVDVHSCECGEAQCNHYYVTTLHNALLTSRELTELFDLQELP